jgi:diguanylate cyclase (GGDEF)-like protein
MALRDGLTGLYNRRYLEDALIRELHRAERGAKPVSVVMIDIDHFKQFNDNFGHDAGDFVLSALARAIAKSIRPSDIACRYGGEELAIVLPDASLECAQERIAQIRVAIRNTNPTHLGQALPPPTASFGIAVYPKDGTMAADLLRAADQALYRAKQAGRDRVCVAGQAAHQGS